MSLYAIDTYTVAHGHGLQPAHTVTVPTRNALLAGLDARRDAWARAGHGVTFPAVGVTVARTHTGALRGVAIARTTATQPRPAPPDLVVALAESDDAPAVAALLRAQPTGEPTP